MQKTGTKRPSILSAAAPLGLREFWPFSGPRQPARRSRVPSTARPTTALLVTLARFNPRDGTSESLSVAEAVERGGAALPVPFDPHLGLEVDPGTEEGLELVAGGGAGLFEHPPAAPDDHSLLRLALDVHEGVQSEQVRIARRAARLVDLARHGDGVGQLVARVRQELLAQDLGGEDGLGLVGDDAVRVVGGSFGQPGLELVEEGVGAVARLGRQGREDVVVAQTLES